MALPGRISIFREDHVAGSLHLDGEQRVVAIAVVARVPIAADAQRDRDGSAGASGSGTARPARSPFFRPRAWNWAARFSAKVWISWKVQLRSVPSALTKTYPRSVRSFS